MVHLKFCSRCPNIFRTNAKRGVVCPDCNEKPQPNRDFNKKYNPDKNIKDLSNKLGKIKRW